MKYVNRDPVITLERRQQAIKMEIYTRVILLKESARVEVAIGTLQQEINMTEHGLKIKSMVLEL